MYHGKNCFYMRRPCGGKSTSSLCLDWIVSKGNITGIHLDSGFLFMFSLLSLIFFYFYVFLLLRKSLQGMWGIQVSHNTESVKVIERWGNTQAFTFASQLVQVVHQEKVHAWAEKVQCRILVKHCWKCELTFLSQTMQSWKREHSNAPFNRITVRALMPSNIRPQMDYIFALNCFINSHPQIEWVCIHTELLDMPIQ